MNLDSIENMQIFIKRGRIRWTHGHKRYFKPIPDKIAVSIYVKQL